ncbi:MAG TPA: cyclase family protein [Vicinamibacteria bacterium]|nr:cyclase family protein [Vicinamibacteria bacterium]
MSKIIDVTIPLSPQLPVYPGDPRFALEATQRIEAGDPCNLSKLAFGAHAGTHVDAPYHFLADGATVDQLPLEILMGKARVVQVAAPHSIERSDLEALDLRDDLRVLIKTRNSGLLRQPDFQGDFVFLRPDAASYLAQAGIKLVGFDYLSIDPYPSPEHPAHHALLEAGVVVVEGLDLSEVEPGEYDMVCLPLRIEGGDGAPARVVLRPRL